jgi:(p)ppGpp synthase/HD superfamily hydrolase
MDDLIEKASAFAKQAHEPVNHHRKYADEPYMVHPATVAVLASSVEDQAG